MPQFQITTQAPLIAFVSVFLLLGGILLLLFGFGIIQSGEGSDLIIKIKSGKSTVLVGLMGMVFGASGIIFSASLSTLLEPTPTPTPTINDRAKESLTLTPEIAIPIPTDASVPDDDPITKWDAQVKELTTLHRWPNPSATEIIDVFSGTQVDLLAVTQDGAWVQAIVNARTGWLKTDHLKINISLDELPVK